MSQLRKYAKPNSIITGDMNCVIDIQLDVRRSASKSAYNNNTGADILRDILSTHNLTDEIRMSLGLDFEYTHSSVTSYKSPTGATLEGTCQTRIDATFTPTIPDVHWTSEISEKLSARITPQSSQLWKPETTR